MRILIAEDDAVSRFLLNKYLTDLGNEVVMTKDGLEAWDVLSSDETVQLAILDWIMPGLNGIEVCRRVRARKQTPYVYIIFLTAKDNLNEVIEGLNAGADDYIKKPFDRNEFQLRLNAGKRVIRLQSELLEMLNRARKAEDNLRQAMDRLRAVIDAVPGYVSWISSDMNYLGVNKNLAESFNMTESEFIGKPVGFINPKSGFTDFVESFFEGDEEKGRIELPTLVGDTMKHTLVVSQKYRDQKASVLVGVDISDRIEAEKALQKARSNEVAVASRIQSTLLFGRPPEKTEQLDIRALSIPSQEVDGDFFDFISPRPGCTDLMIGDVMGKGIPAALVGAATKHQLLRGLNSDSGSVEDGLIPDPAKIVEYAHRKVTPQLLEIESFVTICYARFDETTRQLTFVDCGHTKTVHYCAATDETRFLEGSNAPIGFLEHEDHEQFTISFNTGDVFLFYSDGITETMNPSGELFGEERLISFIRENHRYPAGVIGKRLLKVVEAFREKEAASDDLTLVICRVDDGVDSPMVLQWKETFSCDLNSLTEIRSFFGAFMSESVIPESARACMFEVELALNEAVSNVIRHGQARGELRIQIELTENGWLKIRIIHLGRYFQPGLIKPVNAEIDREGGYGLYIIEQMTDEVNYGQNKSGERYVELKKYTGRTGDKH